MRSYVIRTNARMPDKTHPPPVHSNAEITMFARSMTRRRTRIALTVMLPLALACSENESTGPESNPLIGTWQVTAFEVLGYNYIQRGLLMRLTLSADGTYSVVIENDSFGYCAPGPSCSATGQYSSTPTQIRIDSARAWWMGPGTEEEITFDYSMHGTTMMFTTDIEGTRTTLILQKS
jgi:hypothetical protein